MLKLKFGEWLEEVRTHAWASGVPTGQGPGSLLRVWLSSQHFSTVGHGTPDLKGQLVKVPCPG